MSDYGFICPTCKKPLTDATRAAEVELGARAVRALRAIMEYVPRHDDPSSICRECAAVLEADSVLRAAAAPGAVARVVPDTTGAER